MTFKWDRNLSLKTLQNLSLRKYIVMNETAMQKLKGYPEAAIHSALEITN